MTLKYDDFDVQIEPAGDKYRVRLLNAPTGQATTDFVLPFTDVELGNFLARIGQVRRSMRRVDAPELQAAKEFGGKLFNSIFSGEMIAQLRGSMEQAADREHGLRIRLRLTDVPALGDLPWEFLYDANQNHFVTTSTETPLVRFLDLPQRIAPLRVALPLRVLVVIAGPRNLKRLDTDGEWQRLTEALGDLLDAGHIVLERLPAATLDALRLRARGTPFHVLHFIGHGGFDDIAQDGVLQFEDDSAMSYPVRGELLGMLLRDHRSLRLAVLNACEGARSSRQDPFSGVAQSLLQQRVPAVIAMQFEISDAAAKEFAQEFYRAVAEGNPVDAAVCEARKALFKEEFGQEWATPALYMRSQEGQLFELQPAAQPVPDQDAARKAALEREAAAKAEAERAAQAEKERQEREKILAELQARERAGAERVAQAEKERKEQDRLLQERQALERAEAERVAQAEKERKEQDRLLQERQALERAETERAAKAEKERLDREKALRERRAQEKAEAERAAKAESERKERDKALRERQAQEKAEADRRARELQIQERLQREKEKAAWAPVDAPVSPKLAAYPSKFKQQLQSTRALILLVVILVVGLAGSLAIFRGKNKTAAAPSVPNVVAPPNDAAAHNNLAGSLLQKGDLDGAIAEYRESLRQSPQDPETHYALAGVLEKKGQHDTALTEYRETLRLQPDFDKSHLFPDLSTAEKTVEPVAPAPPAPVSTAKNTALEKNTLKPISVSGGVQEARLIRKVQPVYPPLARETDVSGIVRLHLIIAKDGTVQEVDALSGHPLLLQSAMNAVKQWRYKPTLLHGIPVPVDTTVDVIYTLFKGPAAPLKDSSATDLKTASAVSHPAAQSPCSLRNIQVREQGNTLVGTLDYSYQGSFPLDSVAVGAAPLTRDGKQISGLTIAHSTLKSAVGTGYFSIEGHPSLTRPAVEGAFLLVSIFVKQNGTVVCSQTFPYQRKW